MEENNTESISEEVKSKKTQKKKASTGAWWKSTTTFESQDAATPAPKRPSRKPRGSKAAADGGEQKSLPETPPRRPKKRGPRAGTKKVSPAEENGLAPITADKNQDVMITPEEQSEAAPVREEKRTARKKPSRGRRKPAKKVGDDAPEVSGQLAEELGEKAAVEAEKEAAADVEEKPARGKKPVRKRGRPRKSAAKPPEKLPGDPMQQTGAETASPEEEMAAEAVHDADVSPPREKPRKPARKRGGRKKKSQPEKNLSQEAQQEAGTAEETAADEQPVQEVRAEAASIEDEKIETLEQTSGDVGLEDEDSGAETAEITPKPDAKAEADEERKEEAERQKKKPKPVIKLLINAEEPEECRLALLEDGRLESIHVATSTRTQTKNNIYKAKIVAIEPNLQAAFVEYGAEKNGFLPFSEIHPEYYKEDVTDKVQKYIDQHQWKRLSITDVMEKGREVLVQVVKEEVGKKGANMTTYLSLPGRCVVLMPGSDSTGISRKISGEEKRSQLRDYILSIGIPEGIGWIVRTASNDITKTALSRDVNYLLKLWEDVKKKGQELDGVGLIYQDHDHVLRFLREHFDPDIQEILVDNEEALEQVASFIDMLPKKQRKVKCKLHRGARPIFNQYSIEDQIESIYQPKVNLPSGGSIVIDPTEALVAIDVNSGSTQKGQNFEETIFQANMEAASELARQLRLRDLGGLIVIDFIDMRSKKNIREVERQVKAAMKRDKAKVDISRLSKFGLMQISRQKLGAPIEAGNYRVCNHCKGRGIVRSVETLALYYLRRIHTGATRKMVRQIECRFPLDVAQYLLNNKRSEIIDLESKYNTEVIITAIPSYRPADNEIVFHKAEKEESAKKRS